MTDLTKIHTVILVDGYGRKYETINAKIIHTITDIGTMWIRHEGTNEDHCDDTIHPGPNARNTSQDPPQ